MRVIILVFILSSFFSLQAKEIEILPEVKCEYEMIISIKNKKTNEKESNTNGHYKFCSQVKYQDESINYKVATDPIPFYLLHCKFLN